MNRFVRSMIAVPDAAWKLWMEAAEDDNDEFDCGQRLIKMQFYPQSEKNNDSTEPMVMSTSRMFVRYLFDRPHHFTLFSLRVLKTIYFEFKCATI